MWISPHVLTSLPGREELPVAIQTGRGAFDPSHSFGVDSLLPKREALMERFAFGLRDRHLYWGSRATQEPTRAPLAFVSSKLAARDMASGLFRPSTVSFAERRQASSPSAVAPGPSIGY
jgi:hypothetical protein